MTNWNFLAKGQRRQSLKRLLSPFRKVARKLLLPLIHKQYEMISQRIQESHGPVGENLHSLRMIQQAQQTEIARLTETVSQLTRQLAALQALAWDHVAMSRRLATIEDRIIELYDHRFDDGESEMPAPQSIPMSLQRLQPVTQAG